MKKTISIIGVVIIAAAVFAYYQWDKYRTNEINKKYYYNFKIGKLVAEDRESTKEEYEDFKKDIVKYDFTPQTREEYEQFLAKRAAKAQKLRELSLKVAVWKHIASVNRESALKAKESELKAREKALAEKRQWAGVYTQPQNNVFENPYSEPAETESNKLNLIKFEPSYDVTTYEPAYKPKPETERYPRSSDGYLTKERGWIRVNATEYIKPNAYGLGTGMNQYGMPVKTVPAN